MSLSLYWVRSGQTLKVYLTSENFTWDFLSLVPSNSKSICYHFVHPYSHICSGEVSSYSVPLPLFVKPEDPHPCQLVEPLPFFGSPSEFWLYFCHCPRLFCPSFHSVLLTARPIFPFLIYLGVGGRDIISVVSVTTFAISVPTLGPASRLLS